MRKLHLSKSCSIAENKHSIDVVRCFAKSERKLHNIGVIMEKCRGYGKSKKVMIWLRMGYVFSLRLRLSFFFFAQLPRAVYGSAHYK